MQKGDYMDRWRWSARFRWNNYSVELMLLHNRLIIQRIQCSEQLHSAISCIVLTFICTMLKYQLLFHSSTLPSLQQPYKNKKGKHCLSKSDVYFYGYLYIPTETLSYKTACGVATQVKTNEYHSLSIARLPVEQKERKKTITALYYVLGY